MSLCDMNPRCQVKEKAMRSSKWLAVLAFVSGLCCAGQTQSSGTAGRVKYQWPGYTISAAPVRKPLRLDSPINIEITITNPTDQNAAFCNGDSSTVYAQFRFSLVTDGREVEKTLFHENLTGRQQRTASSEDWNQHNVCGLLPKGNWNIKETIDLKRLYEITEPGQYILEISHLEEDQKTIVSAPKLELEIEPKPEPGP